MSKTFTHEGVTYEIIEGVAKPGDLVFYSVDGGAHTGVSRVAVEDYDPDDFYTEDDAYVWVAHGDSYEVIEELSTFPSVEELIANLARRVSELEGELANRDYYEGMVAAYPEMDAESPKAEQIRQACDAVRDLLIRKNHDYGDSFAQQYAKYGLQSALIRMDDKMRRLETLADGAQAQVAESIEDSLADLAGYALLALVEARK